MQRVGAQRGWGCPHCPLGSPGFETRAPDRCQGLPCSPVLASRSSTRVADLPAGQRGARRGHLLSVRARERSALGRPARGGAGPGAGPGRGSPARPGPSLSLQRVGGPADSGGEEGGATREAWSSGCSEGGEVRMPGSWGPPEIPSLRQPCPGGGGSLGRPLTRRRKPGNPSLPEFPLPTELKKALPVVRWARYWRSLQVRVPHPGAQATEGTIRCPGHLYPQSISPCNSTPPPSLDSSGPSAVTVQPWNDRRPDSVRPAAFKAIELSTPGPRPRPLLPGR